MRYHFGETMKFRTALLLSVLLAGGAQAYEPTEAELDDWMSYMRSVGIPSTVKICGPLMNNEAGFTAAADAWTAANQAAVERGHALAQANPPKGQPLEEYTAGLVRDFESKLAAKPADEQMKICTGYLKLLEQRAKSQ